MKFKVGDTVIVREWDDMVSEFGIDLYGSIKLHDYAFITDMKKYCGNIFIIKDIALLCDGYLLEDADDWVFDSDSLIPYSFTKKDLKTGMVVQIRSGVRYMVYKNMLVRHGLCGKLLDYYDDNFNEKTCKDFDIIKCFDVDQSRIHCIEDILKKSVYDRVLWQREPEEKVISSDEAFKVLKEHYGCDVKIKES